MMRAEGLRGCRALLAVLLITAGCERGCHEERAVGQPVAHVHPNGLVLRLAERFDGGRAVQGVAVEETALGFEAHVTAAQRHALAARVELHPRGEPPPRSSRRAWTRPGLRYAIEDAGGGGSGGEEYVFTAWRRCGEGYLLFEQREQSELGTPSFALAWEVVEGTRCP